MDFIFADAEIFAMSAKAVSVKSNLFFDYINILSVNIVQTIPKSLSLYLFDYFPHKLSKLHKLKIWSTYNTDLVDLLFQSKLIINLRSITKTILLTLDSSLGISIKITIKICLK